MSSPIDTTDAMPRQKKEGNNNGLEMSATTTTTTTTKKNALPLADFKFPEKKDKNNDDDDDEENSNDYYNYKYNPATMPVISLQQGLVNKATPWALASWVKLALTLDGRDKITKVCQYSARMLAWWFAGQTNQMRRFKAVQASLTTSRKAFRLGRSLIEIQKIRDSGFLELFFNPNSNNKCSSRNNDPAWKIVGNVMKMVGLMGFWAGDNVNFLTGAGLFDDYQVSDPKERLAKRNDLKTRAGLFANRFYFFGSLAGLLTSLRVYWSYRQTAIRQAHERLLEATKRVSQQESGQARDETTNNSRELWREAKMALDKAREKQFQLFLVLLKSCVDVMVFSNNPGIDLHQKFRGKKNHEGLHCLCGLISASTVLYTNYPNASSK